MVTFQVLGQSWRGLSIAVWVSHSVGTPCWRGCLCDYPDPSHHPGPCWRGCLCRSLLTKHTTRPTLSWVSVWISWQNSPPKPMLRGNVYGEGVSWQNIPPRQGWRWYLCGNPHRAHYLGPHRGKCLCGKTQTWPTAQVRGGVVICVNILTEYTRHGSH